MDAINAGDVLELLRRLPPRERLRVITEALPELEQNLSQSPVPRRPLQGLWKGESISEGDIEHARREMWADFPREDIAP